MRCKIYAALSPLERLGNDITWDETRGWLDEMAKVARHYVFENMQEWSSPEYSGSAMEKNEDETEGAPSDSNSDPYTEWWPQGGRDISVTLSEGLETSDEKQPGQNIQRIVNVVKKQ
jgi:broad specificity phosphatase PhoE